MQLAAAEPAHDIVIYGGTSAAVVAAVQAKKMGKTVIIVSPDKHLGGLTSGGLAQVIKGLTEGDRVIARAGTFLKDGDVEKFTPEPRKPREPKADATAEPEPTKKPRAARAEEQSE